MEPYAGLRPAQSSYEASFALASRFASTHHNHSPLNVKTLDNGSKDADASIMWLIKSKTEKDWDDVTPLYWSNDIGWVDRESATAFLERIPGLLMIGSWEWERK
jgi:hypothetical protein